MATMRGVLCECCCTKASDNADAFNVIPQAQPLMFNQSGRELLEEVEVTDRQSLMAELYRAADGDRNKVLSCLVSFSPPAERLILRSQQDFEYLGITPELVLEHADKTFWAFKDFHQAVSSFELGAADRNRRVLGIEGIGSKHALQAAIKGGERKLRFGHLPLQVMEAKLRTGEWHWIDEKACVMHTATAKPALLRRKVESLLNVSIAVRKGSRDKFSELATGVMMKQPIDGALVDFMSPETGASELDLPYGTPDEAYVELSKSLRDRSKPVRPMRPVSLGELVVFDVDREDVRKAMGNTNVFCLEPTEYVVKVFGELDAKYRQAVEKVLNMEFKAAAPLDLRAPGAPITPMVRFQS